MGVVVDPFRVTVPFCREITQVYCSLPAKRGSGPKGVEVVTPRADSIPGGISASACSVHGSSQIWRYILISLGYPEKCFEKRLGGERICYIEETTVIQDSSG